MTTIRELRILPPLAIGRLGAAEQPVDNYTVEVDPERPLGYRRLVPAETLRVDVGTGEITGTFVPDQLTFSDGDAVRPVAPFLELWAVTDAATLEPVTVDLLRENGLTPGDVRWRTQVGNIKVFRRTQDPKDKMEADTGEFTDHARRALAAECANFLDGKTLPLGHVQYVKPTDAFPEIRLRFTPAGGFVYGANRKPPGWEPPEDRVLYDADKGGWYGYFDQPGNPDLTVPGQIYASLDDANTTSRGFFDDECDGIVRASLDVGGTTLTAFARIGAGPPAYAPDSFPVRTVHDELEQAMFGPEAQDEVLSFDRVEEIVRRAFETIRLMNAAAMNGNVIDGRTNVASTMVRQDTNDTGRLWEPIMATSLVDTKALEQLHQNILVALRGGSAPWFADVLRKYDEVGDLSDSGRRKMPALMRNADGRSLALTRRQVDIVRRIAEGPIFPEAEA